MSSGSSKLDIKAILLKYGNENLLNEFQSSSTDINDRILSDKEEEKRINKKKKI